MQPNVLDCVSQDKRSIIRTVSEIEVYMNDFNETIFLQESLVKVTNLYTTIGTITYSMSDIKSVSLTMRAKSYRPLLWLPLGLLLISWAVFDETGQFSGFLNIGIVLSLVSIFLFSVARPTYGIEITTTSDRRRIFRSTDLALTQKIVDAMKRALADRGNMDFSRSQAGHEMGKTTQSIM